MAHLAYPCGAPFEKRCPQQIIEIESKISSKSVDDWYHFIQEVYKLNNFSIAYDNTIN